ncbi:NAD-dependent epimerase/dehydratase family protein [Amycolatopsis sp. CA-126428]|uniref:NAD-dependent epimerase/dehydratase family protein n=1 Tax=Amycolatopsis sp. CA-126428 TaxID=2073158 RepID=UPI0018EE0F24|nr:NAD-dependent epimerase/dehydratase family protein [Amycolatopsis sp. CA-126428]
MVNSKLPGTVVVTGAAGVLGARLVQRLLDEGCRVHSVDLRDIPAAPGLRHHIGDVRDPRVVADAMAGADAVVHCAAALPSYPADEIRSIIVGGAENVLGTAAAAGLARAVHISSTSVYGLPKTVPTPESHPREPVDTYGAAKAEAEEYAERLRAQGLCLTILRPKTFVGTGRMGLFAMLFEWASEGRHFPVLGRGDVRIQMLGLDDLVTAVVTALVAPREVADDTYNIAAERFGTIREDFQAVLDAAGHGKHVVPIPARPAVAVLGLLERWKLSPVYGRLLHKLLDDSFVSTGKAARRLGFVPRLSNSEALLEAFTWWRSGRVHAPAKQGVTSREPWRQGALKLAKVFF